MKSMEVRIFLLAVIVFIGLSAYAILERDTILNFVKNSGNKEAILSAVKDNKESPEQESQKQEVPVVANTPIPTPKPVDPFSQSEIDKVVDYAKKYQLPELDGISNFSGISIFKPNTDEMLIYDEKMNGKPQEQLIHKFNIYGERINENWGVFDPNISWLGISWLGENEVFTDEEQHVLQRNKKVENSTRVIMMPNMESGMSFSGIYDTDDNDKEYVDIKLLGKFKDEIATQEIHLFEKDKKGDYIQYNFYKPGIGLTISHVFFKNNNFDTLLIKVVPIGEVKVKVNRSAQ